MINANILKFQIPFNWKVITYLQKYVFSRLKFDKNSLSLISNNSNMYNYNK